MGFSLYGCLCVCWCLLAGREGENAVGRGKTLTPDHGWSFSQTGETFKHSIDGFIFEMSNFFSYVK